MHYRKLGTSDLEVSEISLGSWLTYSGGVEREQAEACVKAAFDAGINFFDTANVYGRGAAETLLGEVLAGYERSSYVLATKVYFSMSDTDRGLSAAQIHKQLDASLERLRTDHVDLYQCHRLAIVNLRGPTNTMRPMGMDSIIYAAKSTKDPKGSIPTQLADCRKLAEGEGYPVVAEYQDEAKSAYHGSRGDGLARARAHAERIAPCILIVQHSDRLARGDAVQGAHLVEYALWAIKANVTIKSVQDPRACESILDAALMGMRNNEDSARKSSSIKDGYRRTVERGEWRGGILPGGYEVHHEVDGRGKVKRWITKHAEDEPHYDLIWRLGEQGASMQRISLELGRAGALTRPVRTRIGRGGREVEYQPRPFTTNRVQQVLNNPFYAGQQTYRGERYEGDWPTYVDIGTFERLKSDQALRWRHEARARPTAGGLSAQRVGALRSVRRHHAGGQGRLPRAALRLPQPARIRPGARASLRRPDPRRERDRRGRGRRDRAPSRRRRLPSRAA